jgi:hypothetical protein
VRRCVCKPCYRIKPESCISDSARRGSPFEGRCRTKTPPLSNFHRPPLRGAACEKPQTRQAGRLLERQNCPDRLDRFPACLGRPQDIGSVTNNRRVESNAGALPGACAQGAPPSRVAESRNTLGPENASLRTEVHVLSSFLSILRHHVLSVCVDHLVLMQLELKQLDGHSQFHEEIGLRFDANPKFWGIPLWLEKRDNCGRRNQ